MSSAPASVAASNLPPGRQDDDAGGGGDASNQDDALRPTEAGAPKILLVEDDFLVGMEMEEGLRRAGYDLIGIAVTADDAVRRAAAEHPRLVIMDIRLIGKRDGVDAALEIFTGQGIRSLFASAHCDEEVRARAEAARPLGWVSKPYRVDILVAAVRRALQELEKDE